MGWWCIAAAMQMQTTTMEKWRGANRMIMLVDDAVFVFPNYPIQSLKQAIFCRYDGTDDDDDIKLSLEPPLVRLGVILTTME